MSTLKSGEFWIGVIAAVVVMKFAPLVLSKIGVGGARAAS